MKIEKIVVGPLLTNCYILSSNKKAIVIDPGGDLEKILKSLEKKKLVFIILTHSHFDHTLVAKKLKEEKGGEILIHKKEKEFLEFEADRYLEDGEKIELGKEVLKIIHTPGHSSGSICVLGKNFLFSGDTLFFDGVGRTDLPGGSEKDLKNSLEKLKKIIQPEMKIYPGHGPEFLGKEIIL